MAVAGGLHLCSPRVVRNIEMDLIWNSCLVSRRGPDVHCSKWPRIPPIHQRLWKLSNGTSNCVPTRRRALFPSGAQVQEDNLEGIDPEKSVLEFSSTQIDKDGATLDTGWDPSFLHVLPHVVTAATANFMFGYHIGIVNGPLQSIAKELKFDGDTIVEGFVVSTFIVGAFVGSITGGVLSDTIGRRRTFQICAIPLAIGAAISATAESVEALVLGRLLVGIGIGVNTALVPLYISEISPTNYRGALGCLCQIGTCTGLIAALVFGIPADTDPHWWRTMFWVATIPAAFLIAGMQFSAESPRWLGKVGKWNEASSTIEKLWGKEQVDDAMDELRNSDSAQEEEASWSELLSPRYFKVVGIGGALFALQQFAGINGVLYFSSSNFQDAGITNTIAASSFVGFANLAGAIVATTLMDIQGRKKLLMCSYTGMATSVVMMVSAMTIPMDEQISHGLTVIGTLTYVFSFAAGAGPITALIIPEMCSTRIRAKALALSLCVHWVCNFGIGFLFLDLVQRFGLPAVYTSFGVVSLLSVLFTQIFIIETKGQSLEETELLVNLERKAN